MLGTANSVDYVFIDVVGFTSAIHSAKDQRRIIEFLNDLVLHICASFCIPYERRFFLPTGDGLCIAILEYEGKESDLGIRLAADLFSGIEEHDRATLESGLKFNVRVGVNFGIDNLIADINGHVNFAGAGINSCQRIMSFADAGQILIGKSVFDRVCRDPKKAAGRARVSDCRGYRFQQFRCVAKHGELMTLYQVIHLRPAKRVPSEDNKRDTGGTWLNTRVPKQFLLSGTQADLDMSLASLSQHYGQSVAKAVELRITAKNYAESAIHAWLESWLAVAGSKRGSVVWRYQSASGSLLVGWAARLRAARRRYWPTESP